MSVKKMETAGGEKDTFDAVMSSVGRVKAIAQKRFESSKGSHDWDHTLRVYRLCEHIGKAEDVDMEVLLISALLHDIGRDHQDSSNGKMCHAKKGAEIARYIIKALPLDKKQEQNILHAIRSHRFRSTCLPKTREAKVLFDADKLDAIGAVGVARAYLFAGEVGARLHNPDIDVERVEPYSREDTGFREFKVKLSKIRDRILTREGKKLAEKRHAFMDAFFKRFKVEYEGVR
ncbi:MAG: HD domain-containing protein [Desulfobacterales bacterium]|nr:HD domain-containing protein [Desulfobacterales bacterium]MDP6682184.1 HD domain-containing protein [Desulfobacterales bacterium]MDP6807047.1 HD domain-containing protein [Desulfobacterales bacterium]MDP7354214.1 HD domain-containing protein [Desulfobacterales bacterium]